MFGIAEDFSNHNENREFREWFRVLRVSGGFVSGPARTGYGLNAIARYSRCLGSRIGHSRCRKSLPGPRVGWVRIAAGDIKTCPACSGAIKVVACSQHLEKCGFSLTGLKRVFMLVS